MKRFMPRFFMKGVKSPEMPILVLRQHAEVITWPFYGKGLKCIDVKDQAPQAAKDRKKAIEQHLRDCRRLLSGHENASRKLQADILLLQEALAIYAPGEAHAMEQAEQPFKKPGSLV